MSGFKEDEQRPLKRKITLCKTINGDQCLYLRVTDIESDVRMSEKDLKTFKREELLDGKIMDIEMATQFIWEKAFEELSNPPFKRVKAAAISKMKRVFQGIKMKLEKLEERLELEVDGISKGWGPFKDLLRSVDHISEIFEAKLDRAFAYYSSNEKSKKTDLIKTLKQELQKGIEPLQMELNQELDRLKN